MILRNSDESVPCAPGTNRLFEDFKDEDETLRDFPDPFETSSKKKYI